MTRFRILVVDDNVDQVQSMAILFRDLGHEVRLALDGTAALREARAFMPEFIFLDIGLPDMSGSALCRQLRSDPSFGSTRIFAMTGSIRQEDWDEVTTAGCERLLLKPIDPKFLVSLLRR